MVDTYDDMMQIFKNNLKLIKQHPTNTNTNTNMNKNKNMNKNMNMSRDKNKLYEHQSTE